MVSRLFTLKIKNRKLKRVGLFYPRMWFIFTAVISLNDMKKAECHNGLCTCNVSGVQTPHNQSIYIHIPIWNTEMNHTISDQIGWLMSKANLWHLTTWNRIWWDDGTYIVYENMFYKIPLLICHNPFVLIWILGNSHNFKMASWWF